MTEGLKGSTILCLEAVVKRRSGAMSVFDGRGAASQVISRHQHFVEKMTCIGSVRTLLIVLPVIGGLCFCYE
jgi:hypothetical protein